MLFFPIGKACFLDRESMLLEIISQIGNLKKHAYARGLDIALERESMLWRGVGAGRSRPA